MVLFDVLLPVKLPVQADPLRLLRTKQRDDGYVCVLLKFALSEIVRRAGDPGE